jgi:hypothetical protein
MDTKVKCKDECRTCSEIVRCRLIPVSINTAQGNPQIPEPTLPTWNNLTNQINRRRETEGQWEPVDYAKENECHREGISGNCGEDCAVFQRGECDEKWEE